MKSTPTKTQVFRFASPGAMTVQLVGDFTGWRHSPISLSKGPDGVWTTQVPLTPGIHHYRFLVDGEWRDDPECTMRIPNPYGTENAVIQVPEGASAGAGSVPPANTAVRG